MAEPARQLDDVSAHLAEVLRQADALLADWARFGAEVRVQVEREAREIGAAVAGAVDAASERAIAQRLAAFAKELERLEQRVRATSRAVADQRAGDRRLLAGIAVGVAIAIALLAVLVLRSPPPAAGVAPRPIPISAPAAPDAAVADPPPPVPTGSAQAPAGSTQAPAAQVPAGSAPAAQVPAGATQVPAGSAAPPSQTPAAAKAAHPNASHSPTPHAKK